MCLDIRRFFEVSGVIDYGNLSLLVILMMVKFVFFDLIRIGWVMVGVERVVKRVILVMMCM